MKKLFGLAILAILTIMSCGKDAEPGTVVINFEHKVGDKTLELDNMIYTSAAGHPFLVARLKYFVSNISLHNTDGTTYNADVVHYYEEGKDETKSLSLAKIPAGTYNKISFVYGLDETTNVDGGLENTQTNQNMEWPIPGDQGYHYMKLEGRYDSLATGVIKNFNLHTGAAQNVDYYIEHTLAFPTEIKIDNNSWDIDLMMDLNEWLVNPTVYDFEDYGQMIMMNPTAQAVLKANGADVFSVDAVRQK